MSDDRTWTWTPQVEAGQVVATLRKPPVWQVLHDMTAFLELSFQMPIVVRHPEGDGDFYTFLAVPRALGRTLIPSITRRPRKRSLHVGLAAMITGVPVLRAIPEVGEPYDDPSEDLLFILLEDIEAGHGTFLILERSSDGAGQTYAQAERRPDGSYTVEHREGDAEHHFGTAVVDMRAAHRLLTGWAFELGDWDAGTRWTQVTV